MSMITKLRKPHIVMMASLIAISSSCGKESLPQEDKFINKIIINRVVIDTLEASLNLIPENGIINIDLVLDFRELGGGYSIDEVGNLTIRRFEKEIITYKRGTLKDEVSPYSDYPTPDIRITNFKNVPEGYKVNLESVQTLYKNLDIRMFATNKEYSHEWLTNKRLSDLDKKMNLMLEQYDQLINKLVRAARNKPDEIYNSLLEGPLKRRYSILKKNLEWIKQAKAGEIEISIDILDLRDLELIDLNAGKNSINEAMNDPLNRAKPVGPIHFTTGESKLTQPAKTELEKYFRTLTEGIDLGEIKVIEVSINITGYSDDQEIDSTKELGISLASERGRKQQEQNLSQSEFLNLLLSERRAKEVREYLKTRFQLLEQQNNITIILNIKSVGRGQQRPDNYKGDCFGECTDLRVVYLAKAVIPNK